MDNFFIKYLVISTVFFFFSSTVLPAQDQNVDSVVSANNQFAFELYKQHKDKEGNIFFSPYSLSATMAMAYEGARAGTREEIKKVFHFPEDDTACREGFLAINKRINLENQFYQFKTANALWVQKGFNLLDGYVNIIEQYYGGRVTNLDFAANPDASCRIINRWVAEETEGKIKNLISPFLLSDLTRLILTNAVYFKGRWLFEFDKTDTQDKDFHLDAEKIVKVPMMFLSYKRLNYGETEDLEILEMSYKGEELSMLILLPKDFALAKLEDVLTSEKLAELKANLSKRMVRVYFPRFILETEYRLINDLVAMGIQQSFSEKLDNQGFFEADFSGITGEKNLKISEIIQKAFVDVNEEGTEAAVVTQFQSETIASGDSLSPKIFNANHPFIFIIQDRKTGNILFLGRIVDPRKSN